MLPMQPYTPRPASTPLTTLVMRVYPSAGDADNTYTLYEDDGVTRDYEQGAYATTQLNYRRTGRVTTVTVRPTAGSYEGQVVKRAYRLQLPAASSGRLFKYTNLQKKTNPAPFSGGDSSHVPVFGGRINR